MSLLDQDGKPTRVPVVVMVAAPVREYMSSYTAFDLARLAAYSATQGASIALNVDVGTTPVMQRTTMIREALELGVTHVLWIEDGMRFPMDALLRLLAGDADVVSGHAGMGFLLEKLDLYRQLPEPWFQAGYTGDAFEPEMAYHLRAVAGMGIGVYIQDDLSGEVRHVGAPQPAASPAE
jgi:hypothetical protein